MLELQTQVNTETGLEHDEVFTSTGGKRGLQENSPLGCQLTSYLSKAPVRGWIVFPLPKHVEVLTPSAWECGLI